MTLTLSMVLGKISHMPEPPKAAIQAINLLEDPSVPVAKAAEFISMDETLTAKLLRLSNSAYYGFQGRITTVNEAIVRLGVNVVKCSLYASMMESSGLKISPFFLELWRSALYTAMMSKDIGVMLNHPRKDLCFTAGLLCDLGQILMNEAAEKVYPDLVTAVRRNNANMAEIELEFYGFNHTHVGAKLAEVWQLPPVYENVIRFHHAVDDIKNRLLPEDHKLMMIVSTANVLSPLFSEDWTKVPLPFKTLKQMGLSAPNEVEFLQQLGMHKDCYQRDVTQISNAMFGAPAATR
jgi:HD-like signal output (HDOD) protein